MINAFLYILIVILLCFRTSTEKIALIFFFMVVMLYVIGRDIDANHYMSVVYVFAFLSILKGIYFAIKKNKT